CPGRVDPTDCAPGFAWRAPVFASPVPTSSVVWEEDWRGSLLQGSHHSDAASLRAAVDRIRAVAGLRPATTLSSTLAADLHSVPTRCPVSSWWLTFAFTKAVLWLVSTSANC